MFQRVVIEPIALFLLFMSAIITPIAIAIAYEDGPIFTKDIHSVNAAAHTNTHQITNERSGEGNMSSITAICSCGWRGTPQFAYNDNQLTQVSNESERHLKICSQPK